MPESCEKILQNFCLFYFRVIKLLNGIYFSTRSRDDAFSYFETYIFRYSLCKKSNESPLKSGVYLMHFLYIYFVYTYVINIHK